MEGIYQGSSSYLLLTYRGNCKVSHYYCTSVAMVQVFEKFQSPKPRMCSTITMNELPVIGSVPYTHRVLGSPWGKHCKLL